MKRNTESIVWAVFIATILVAGAWLAVEIATVAAQVAAAALAVVGTIVGAVAKHGFELEKQRRHAVYLEKQKAYTDLLSKIGAFARSKRGTAEGVRTGDELSTAHLASWAFGDIKVIKATNVFQRDPSPKTLTALLQAIRESLQYSYLPDDFFEEYDADVLFAPSEQTVQVPGLGSGSGKR